MRDDELDDLLRHLAHSDAGLRPPASLERRTMAAYDAWRVARADVRPRSRSAWAVAAALAAAATLMAAILLPMWRAGQAGTAADDPPVSDAASRLAVVPPPVPPQTRQAPVDGGTAVAGDVVPDAERAARAAARLDWPRTAPRAPARARRQEALRFTPLGPEFDDVEGAFHLSRVQVPRRVLIDLGVLAEGRQGDEPIAADVMFGEDGMARAIRLAPARRMP